MPTLSYQIFNKHIKLTDKVILQFIWEIEKLFNKFKEDKDIDNLKVLKNKLLNLLEESPKNLSKIAKKEYKILEELLEEFDEFIEKQENLKEKAKLIDVVKEVEKNYKKCDTVPNSKKDDYTKYCVKNSKVDYEKELIKLQVELLKLQRYIKENWEKLLIIFEWRDAAWKWGTIKRFTEYLNPRWARVVALEKPSDLEKTQWYFQRYINHLPAGWEMTLFDRSWYNRAWVEPVMWFVSEEKYKRFLHDVPKFEKMLVDSWVKIIKFYFSVSKDEQAKRFEGRKYNPLKQYKLSPIDQFSQQLWKKYTLAEYKNFTNTHTKESPWILINSDDKKKARINAIKYVLNQYDYPEKMSKKELKLDKKIVMDWKAKAKILSTEIDVNDDLFE
jgi:polyphosphate kinase 2